MSTEQIAATDRQRAIAIAMYGWRFCLLAVHPEYGAGGTRRRAALDADMRDPDFPDRVGLSELVQIACAGPLDALCAEAVANIKGPGQTPDLEEFLKLLPEDRALGIFYALHPQRRKAALRQAYWRELVASGPAPELVKEVGIDVANADILGVGRWTREAWPLILPEEVRDG